MKQISIVLLVSMTIFSCQNMGDKNQSGVKVRETDSAIKANDVKDAAGSSGRNDTAMTPNQTSAPSATTSAPAMNNNTDSTGVGNIGRKVADSSTFQKNKSTAKDPAR